MDAEADEGELGHVRPSLALVLLDVSGYSPSQLSSAISLKRRSDAGRLLAARLGPRGPLAPTRASSSAPIEGGIELP